MTKYEIATILENTHQELFDWLNNQPDKSWIEGPEGKWTVGQHILHLVDASKLLNKAVGYPKFILKYKFGKSNRPSRSYDEVAKRYREKLSQNQEKAKTFNQDLRIPNTSERKQLIAQLQLENKKLQVRTHKWKDKHLDTLLIPHPLMGRMTVREIIMWSAYHTQHHTSILKEIYS